MKMSFVGTINIEDQSACFSATADSYQQSKTMLKIKVNGEDYTVDNGASVADLLKQLEKNPKFLAVENNRELIPRTEHANCKLQNGDEIEIVTLVGGG